MCIHKRGMGHFILCIVFSEAAPAKRGRPKKSPVSLQDRYPELESDPIMVESHQEALVKKMKNAKPRSDIFIPLMKSTFMARRQFILTEARSVVQILDIYPALNQVSAVSMCFVLHIPTCVWICSGPVHLLTLSGLLCVCMCVCGMYVCVGDVLILKHGKLIYQYGNGIRSMQFLEDLPQT